MSVHEGVCINCGEDMVGDGYSTINRCPNSDDETWDELAPDEGPIYCLMFTEMEDDLE